MRILIADDNSNLANTLAELFRLSADPPPETDVCYDGAQALRLAMQQHHDVAVLDIDMPSLSGTVTAHCIREALAARRPLLIALTGNPKRDESSGIWQAFDHVLSKPVDLDQLLGLAFAQRASDRPELRLRDKPQGNGPWAS